MYHFIKKTSQGMALAGGAMLGGLIILICVSILGRSLNSILHSDLIMGAVPGIAQGLLDLGIGPVNGDFELVEAGIAFSIFAFMPLCHVTLGHATVDILSAKFPPRVARVLAVLTDIIFAAALIILATQLLGGLQTKLRTGETTFLLEIPVWWGYALSLFAAVVTALVSVAFALLQIGALVTGAPLIEDTSGAGH